MTKIALAMKENILAVTKIALAMTENIVGMTKIALALRLSSWHCTRPSWHAIILRATTFIALARGYLTARRVAPPW